MVAEVCKFLHCSDRSIWAKGFNAFICNDLHWVWRKQTCNLCDERLQIENIEGNAGWLAR